MQNRPVLFTCARWSDMEAVFYGIRAGHPPAVLWMNVSMGFGLVYISWWSIAEFIRFFCGACTTYERVYTGITLVLYALAGVTGTMTMVEAVGHNQGIDMTNIRDLKASLAVVVSIAAVSMLASQIWLWPLWRNRRQWLLRYLGPEMVQLRNDLLNLSAAEAELHLDIHHENYANRTIVEAVAARCHEIGISTARQAIVRMATSLITFHRDNVIQDPSYGLAISWDTLMEEAAAEIDQTMAKTAWERALRDSYVVQHVYIIMFLVLDSHEYRERLLINERPRVQPWHEQLADLIATVMQEHGHSTPRAATMAQRGTTEKLWTWIRMQWPSRCSQTACIASSQTNENVEDHGRVETSQAPHNGHMT